MTVTTASGTFSPGRLDAGTEVLLKYTPAPPPTGTFLDIGCGWGPLTLALALESPEATVFGIDVNERAQELSRDNAENLGLTGVTVCHPDDVPPQLTFDLIWSNPPIRVGKVELHNILARWLPRLRQGGQAWLVVAKKLGGDSLQDWLNSGAAGMLRAERAETARGYRVIRVTKL